MIDLARIRQWTEELQDLPDGSLEQAARALGLGSSLVARSGRSVAVEPPPDGTYELELVRDEHGLTRIDLELVQGVTRDELDRELGAGVNGPRSHPEVPYQRRYLRSRPGLPHYCVVYAEFEGDEPRPDSVATMLTVMRERREP